MSLIAGITGKNIIFGERNGYMSDSMSISPTFYFASLLLFCAINFVFIFVAIKCKLLLYSAQSVVINRLKGLPKTSGNLESQSRNCLGNAGKYH